MDHCWGAQAGTPHGWSNRIEPWRKERRKSSISFCTRSIRAWFNVHVLWAEGRLSWCRYTRNLVKSRQPTLCGRKWSYLYVCSLFLILCISLFVSVCHSTWLSLVLVPSWRRPTNVIRLFCVLFRELFKSAVYYKNSLKASMRSYSATKAIAPCGWIFFAVR